MAGLIDEAKLIYRNQFLGEAGSEYSIEIYWRDQSLKMVRPNEFRTFSPGFTLSYQGAGDDELNAYVVGSEVVVNWMVEDNNQRTFLEGIISANEDDYILVIRKDDALFWAGFIEYEGGTFEDQYYPYEYQLKAHDALGRLQNYNYTNEVFPLPSASRRESITSIIIDILSRTHIDDAFNDDDTFLKTIMHWNYFRTVGEEYNIWEYAQLDPYVFQKLDTENLESMTCLEALQMLLKGFDARIIQTGGSYLVEQINGKSSESYTVYEYTKLGTGNGSNITKFETDTFTRFSGATFAYKRALQRVKISYLYYNLDQNQLPDTILPSQNYSFAAYQGQAMRFVGRIFFDFDSNSTPENEQGAEFITFYAVFHLSVGNYSLISDGGVLKWQYNEGGGSVGIKATTTQSVQTPAEFEGYFHYQLNVPPLPINGTAYFMYEGGVADAGTGDDLEYPETTIFNTVAESFMLNYFLVGQGGLNRQTFEAYNAASAEAEPRVNNLLDLGTIQFGDGPTATASGLIYNSQDSGLTRRWGTGDISDDARTLLQRLLRDLIKRQYQAVTLYRAEFQASAFNPSHSLTFRGDEYMFLQGSMEGQSEIWNAELFRFDLDNTTTWDSPVLNEYLEGSVVSYSSGAGSSSGDTISVPIEEGAAALTDVFIEEVDLFPVDILRKTKGGITSDITVLSRPYGVIFGGMVTWMGTGLTFNISPCLYYIGGELYTFLGGPVTLDAADATHPRIDVLYLDTEQSQGVITGTPGEDPVKPSIDPNTQVELSIILVGQGMTTPDLPLGLIYDEKAEGEWTAGNSGGTLDAEATVKPERGTKHISYTSLTNGNALTLAAESTQNLSTYETLRFGIHLLEAMTNQHRLFVAFLTGESLASDEIQVPLNRTNTTAYQIVALTLAQFNFRTATPQADALRLRWTKSGANTTHAGLYLDYVKLEGGIVQPVTPTEHESLLGRDKPSQHPATSISVDSSAFNKNLSSADDTVQNALATLDQMEGGGGGGHTIIDADDNAMTQRTGLQFLGDVTVEDDEPNNRTKVTVTGGGSLPPKYGEIVEWDTYDNGAVKRIKTDYGSSKYIETRVAYHESGDAIGQVDFQEIKDDLTNQWIKITYAYDGAAMTTPSVISVITEWTITV